MKIKENEVEINSGFNSHRNSNFCKNNNFFNSNNMNNSTYDIDKNINNEDFIKKVQKNYSDYYYKNINEIEKFKFYNDILKSINFENKAPEVKDIISIDKLFSINSDDNATINLNTTNLNDSVK